jgi:hypothetical protein
MFAFEATKTTVREKVKQTGFGFEFEITACCILSDLLLRGKETEW